MKTMSDGIQRAAGVQLRQILNKVTKNRFIAVFTGMMTTGILQSSSATTVMTVSFVNASLIGVTEATGLIMGANIGTTVTAWIVSGIGYKISMSTLTLPLMLIGVPLYFRNIGKSKHWGEFIIGFSLLFMGLFSLRQSIPDVNANEALALWLQDFSDTGLLSTLSYVMIGAILTAIIQSSSAAMVLTITMCAKGWLPFELGAAMVLGENIGTTITAEIASLVGRTKAKVTARVHTLFNLIGVSWMILVLSAILPIVGRSAEILFNQGSPFTEPLATSFAISLFHTGFNVLNVILLIGFTPWLIKLASRTVKGSGELEYTRLKLIKSSARTPELSMLELQNEVKKFAEVTAKMNGFLKKMLFSFDQKEFADLSNKIYTYEEITDNLEIDIIEYSTSLSEDEITVETSIQLRSIIKICNDLERIGDIYYQMTKEIQRKKEDKSWFSPYQRTKLNLMLSNLDDFFKLTIESLLLPSNNIDLLKVRILYQEIEDLKLDLSQGFEEYNADKENEINLKGTLIFQSLLYSMTKIGSHLFAVCENAAGKI
jgi:phosphate:Na+ symporter